MDQRLLIRAGMVFHGRTKDISESGLGATVAGQLPRNEPIEVEFRLPGSSVTIKVMAEVRYNQGFQYGLRFLYITEAQRAQIREAVSQLQPAP
jgi:c-di-GMP-binding flagellar brake protein YcgR